MPLTANMFGSVPFTACTSELTKVTLPTNLNPRACDALPWSTCCRFCFHLLVVDQGNQGRMVTAAVAAAAETEKHQHNVVSKCRSKDIRTPPSLCDPPNPAPPHSKHTCVCRIVAQATRIVFPTCTQRALGMHSTQPNVTRAPPREAENNSSRIHVGCSAAAACSTTSRFHYSSSRHVQLHHNALPKRHHCATAGASA